MAMYNTVNTGQRRSRHSAVLWICLAVAAVLIILAIIPVAWSGWYQQQWWGFVGQLSDATTYAYDNDCLQADCGGQPVRVNGEMNYNLYELISKAGRGRLLSEPPQDPADLSLTYGNGARLSLWEVELDDPYAGKPVEGVLLHFVNAEGKSFTYDTDQFSFQQIRWYVDFCAAEGRP